MGTIQAISHKKAIWVRSQRCGCLVTWFCYQKIAKPGNKTAGPSWPYPYEAFPCSADQVATDLIVEEVNGVFVELEGECLQEGDVVRHHLNEININTLRPRRNEQHFADDIFKRIFFNENIWISIKISLKLVPKGPINNIPALVQIMAWCRSGDKPLSEPMMVSLPTHICVTRPQWVKIEWPTWSGHVSIIGWARPQAMGEDVFHGSFTRYVKLRVAHARGMPATDLKGNR